jgi:hypothetical protein
MQVPVLSRSCMMVASIFLMLCRSGISSTFEGAATDVTYQFWVNNKWVDERPKACTPTGFSKEEAPPDFKWYANTPRTEVGCSVGNKLGMVDASWSIINIGLQGLHLMLQQLARRADMKQTCASHGTSSAGTHTQPCRAKPCGCSQS